MDIGGLHPAKFIAELLRVAQAAGVIVHSETAVESIDQDATGFTVRTSRGQVQARQVLVCTNGYTDGATPWLRRRIVPVRSRIIATEPLPSNLMDKLMLDLFPELEPYSVSHTWYGKVAMHRDMIPRIFENKGLLYATGFCGSGVVWAPWIGRKAAQKLLGNTNEAPSAFDFQPPAAIPFYNGKPWFMPFFMLKYRMDDRAKLRRAGR